MRWLAEYLNVTKDEVAVYGDGGNDLDMLAMFLIPMRLLRHRSVPKELRPSSARMRKYSVARHMEKLLLLQK